MSCPLVKSLDFICPIFQIHNFPSLLLAQSLEEFVATLSLSEEVRGQVIQVLNKESVTITQVADTPRSQVAVEAISRVKIRLACAPQHSQTFADATPLWPRKLPGSTESPAVAMYS